MPKQNPSGEIIWYVDFETNRTDINARIDTVDDGIVGLAQEDDLILGKTVHLYSEPMVSTTVVRDIQSC
jgi:hypothetical protein